MGFSKLLFVGCLATSSASFINKKGALRGAEDNLALDDNLAPVQKNYPYYHTTDQIHQELTALADRCPYMKMETKMADDRAIDVITIKATGSTPINKNFLLFGEHARELISPESGLHFAKTLCGETGDGPGDISKDRVASILKDSEFQMVINGNPGSRKGVENGDYCLRVNPNGVDLNRNWDEEWNNLGQGDTYPGTQAFSEPETRLFKELTTAYDPTNFLTVHSGTKGMYMPWAYDMEHLAKRNQPAMMNILKALDKDHCECPFGAAGKEVGYSCPGTCLDWVYDKLKTPYAFAFEIYTGPEMDGILKQRWLDKLNNGMGAFYQLNATLAHPHFKDVFAQNPSDFVQLSMEHKTNLMSQFECFSNFNPDTKERFDAVLENWSTAYLDMAEMVVQDLEAKKGQ